MAAQQRLHVLVQHHPAIRNLAHFQLWLMPASVGLHGGAWHAFVRPRFVSSKRRGQAPAGVLSDQQDEGRGKDQANPEIDGEAGSKLDPLVVDGSAHPAISRSIAWSTSAIGRTKYPDSQLR
jgi:hypothetical protein